ncbi:MAG: ABC transporter permease [Ignavibacteriaceae bacterium]
MFKNYLKISIRNIYRKKSYSIINVFGLSIGIACSILILLWIRDEMSYDRFHKNSNEIYRVVANEGVNHKAATTCGPLAGYLKDNYTDIIKATRYMPYKGSDFKYKNKILKIKNGVFADPDFFEMFSLKFIKGNPKTALSDLSKIVITQSMAKRFFGDKNPVGKTLLVDGKNPVIVSAVIKNVPSNSQLQFDFAINTEILKYIGFPIDSWHNQMLYTFIQTAKSSNIPKLNKQISDLLSQKIPGYNRKLFLQPLTDIHLNTEFSSDLHGLGDIKYIYIFSAIAFFLILIACINYVNLSTSQVFKRSKEVGIKKVMGASRLQVVKQFMLESIIVIAISFLFALVLVEILLPEFNSITGKNVSVNYFSNTFIFVLAALLVFVSIISASYPALFLSSVKPVTALKNILFGNQKGSVLRKSLVVIQFSLAIILIVGTTTVFYQLNYISSKKLGFDKSNIIYFEAKGEFLQNYNVLKNELLSQSSIKNVSAEDRLMTDAANGTGNLYWRGKTDKDNINVNYSYVDYNFFKMLNVRFYKGRNFMKSMGTDKYAYILNKKAVEEMKLKNPINTKFVMNKAKGKIIGVIDNTNFRSLYHKINPMVYKVLNDYSILSFKYRGIIYVKTEAGKTQDAISAIKAIWKKENPNLPFEFHFLNQTIDKQYDKEVQTGEIFSWFALIAIFVSCLGLYGLSLFMIENRTKEIGVRKVLGASVPSILKLFYQDYLKLILLSTIIACPVAWYGMSKWLQNFAYRIDITWWMFLLAGGVALLIALLTVSIQAIKAATANPVESLRYE